MGFSSFSLGEGGGKDVGEPFNPNSQISYGQSTVPGENCGSHISESELPSDFSLGESQSPTARCGRRSEKAPRHIEME